MANSILTPDVIANEGIMHLENSLVIANKIHVDYSKEFAMVGEDISIDRPQRFYGQSDNLDVSSYNEDIIEGKETISMNKTETVKFKVTAKEKTLSLDKISERIVQPAVIVLKDRIESELASLYSSFYHFTGSPGTVPSTFKSLAGMGAVLTDQAVPTMDRLAFHGTDATVELSDGLKGVYVQNKAKTAFEEAEIGRYGGFNNYETVHAPTHTVGAHAGTPLVNGGSQGETYLASKDRQYTDLVTDGWSNSVTGLLKAGDVITIAGVYAVNPITLASTGRLQTFTVLTDTDSDGSGNATVRVSPAIIPASASVANGKAWATVDAEPADNAAITVVTGTAGSQYKQSLLMHKNAMCLVTRPLDIAPGAGVKTATKSGNRVTISCTEWIDGNTLDHNFRFDILFGTSVLDPRLGGRLTN
ncbi:MAG: P22 phage major capsid protein family protein [Pikeienuella sp.]